MNTDKIKLEIVNDGTDDDFSKTFIINDEDHTLANALRYLIMKNVNVVFCGYTIPHPSEIKVNFKIQTNKKVTALDVLEKGLNDLNQVCGHVMETFKKAVDNYESNNQEQMDV